MEEQIDNSKKQKPVILILVLFGILVLIAIATSIQLLNINKSAPLESGLRKVAATLPVIAIDISPSGIIVPGSNPQIMVGTEYELIVNNSSGAKQGIYIPSQNISIVLENEDTDSSKKIRFDSPGRYEFFPSVYQNGWDKWKADFIVLAVPTITPTPTTEPTISPSP